MQQTARRPGRPRPAEVVARDETIYTLIAEGVCSKSALADRTGLDREVVYLACKRLQVAGRIRTCLGPNGGAVWAVADGTPCP